MRSDRVLFPDTGFTTNDAADCYKRVSKWLLPHLKNRAISFAPVLKMKQKLPESVWRRPSSAARAREDARPHTSGLPKPRSQSGPSNGRAADGCVTPRSGS